MKDLIGTEIEVGDTIAYAILTGRSATLGIYEVLAYTDNGKLRVQQRKRSYSTGNSGPSLLSMPERAVVLSKGPK